MAKSTTAKPRAKSNGKAVSPDFMTLALAMGDLVPHDVPGLGMEVFIKPLSAAEVDIISEHCLREGGDPTDDKAYDNDQLALFITAASVVDAKGNRLIPAGREPELEALPAAVFRPLQTKALQVNNMSGTTGN